MQVLSILEAGEKIRAGAFVIDTRPSVAFVKGFIPQSIHMPLSDGFTNYSELFIEPEFEVVVVAEAGKEMLAFKTLARTGFATVAGVLAGGYEAWAASNDAQPDLIIDIDAAEFEMDYQFDEFYLIDTRSEEDYETEHLEYAESIPLAEIEAALPDLNPVLLYYIYGSSFEDALFAGSLFKQYGFHKLRVINQDYRSLKETKIPVAKKKKEKKDTGDFSDN